MPFFSPVSSDQFFLALPTPQSAVVSDKLAALSTDEPLPEAYHVNRIRLLAQSPRKLHLYWEFARNPFETLRRSFGPQAASYTLVIKLVQTETEETSWHVASESRSQWFNVQPDAAYQADVGFYAPGRVFIRLLSSNVVRTPRAGVARRAADADEFRVSPEEFARVLDEAGYASDALEVSLEAADLVTHDAATRAIAAHLAGDQTAQLGEVNLAELRSLLAALALGASPDALSGMLSATLAAWLEQARQEHSEVLRAASLLEILRLTLGIQTSFDYDDLDEEAARRVARFVVGASAVNMPRRPFHIWMPSMTAGLLKGMRDEG
jgi:hypothetical protein